MTLRYGEVSSLEVEVIPNGVGMNADPANLLEMVNEGTYRVVVSGNKNLASEDYISTMKKLAQSMYTGNRLTLKIEGPYRR